MASRRSSLATYYTQLLQSITHSPSACVRPSHTDKCVQPRRRDETCLCAQFCLSAERSTLVAQTVSLHVVFCKKKNILNAGMFPTLLFLVELSHVVKVTNLSSEGRGFDFYLFYALPRNGSRKLFTHMCLCHKQ